VAQNNKNGEVDWGQKMKGGDGKNEHGGQKAGTSHKNIEFKCKRVARGGATEGRKQKAAYGVRLDSPVGSRRGEAKGEPFPSRATHRRDIPWGEKNTSMRQGTVPSRPIGSTQEKITPNGKG